MPNDWLDSLDSVLAQTGVDPTAETRARNRAMQVRAQLVPAFRARGMAPSVATEQAVDLSQSEAGLPTTAPAMADPDASGLMAGLRLPGIRLQAGGSKLLEDLGIGTQPAEVREGTPLATAEAQQTVVQHPITGAIGGALPYVAAGATGQLPAALLVGAGEGVNSYGEGREMGLSPVEAGVRGAGQGAVAGAGMAINPFAKLAPRMIPAAGRTTGAFVGREARDITAAALDAVPQGVVMETGGGAVDAVLGQAIDRSDLTQQGQDRMLDPAAGVERMALVNAILHGVHLPGRIGEARQAVANTRADLGARQASPFREQVLDRQHLIRMGQSEGMDAERVLPGEEAPAEATGDLEVYQSENTRLAADREAAAKQAEVDRQATQQAEAEDAAQQATQAEAAESEIQQAQAPAEVIRARRSEAAASDALRARREAMLQQLEAERQQLEQDTLGKNRVSDYETFGAEAEAQSKRAADAGARQQAAEYSAAVKARDAALANQRKVAAEAADYRKRVASNRNKIAAIKSQLAVRELPPAPLPEVSHGVPAPEVSPSEGRTPQVSAGPERTAGTRAAAGPAPAGPAPAGLTAGGEYAGDAAARPDLPAVRLPGDGGGIPAAGASAASPTPARRSPAGDWPAGEAGAAPVDPHEQVIRESKVREEAAKAETSRIKEQAAGSAAGRSEADAKLADAKARTRSAIEAAQVKGASAEAAKVAVATAKEHVELADARLKHAEARLEVLGEPTPENAEAVKAAKVDVARARADVAEARRDDAEAGMTVQVKKTEASESKLSDYEQAQKDHAERLIEPLQEGLRESMPGVEVKLGEKGAVSVSKDGEHLFDVKLDLEKLPAESVNLPSWWQSMGGKDGIRRWLNGYGGSPVERAAGSRALKLLEGRRPASLEELMKGHAPATLSKLIDLSPVRGGYSRKTGGITAYEVAKLSDIAAIELGRHEGNHRVIHGMLSMALRGEGAKEHIAAIAKVTGVDPSQTNAFLEAAYREYAKWRKTYKGGQTAKAATLADVEAARSRMASESGLGKAMAHIKSWLTSAARFLRLVKDTSGKEGGISLDQAFSDIAEGKFTKAKPELLKGSGEDYSTERRPADEGEKSSNLSMGIQSPHLRDIYDAMQKRVEKTEVQTWAKDQELVDQYVKDVGGQRKAEDMAIKEIDNILARGEMTDDSRLVDVAMRGMERIAQARYDGRGFESEKFAKLMMVKTLLLSDAARELQRGRDRFRTPEQRAASVLAAAYTPSLQARKAIRKAAANIARAKAKGDAASETKARKIFDDITDRINKSRERAIKKMAKYGVDLADGPSMKRLLGGDDYATIMGRIDNMLLIARDDITPADWIVANWKGHLLGDPLVTQTLQAVSNFMSSLSGTTREILRHPAIAATLLRKSVVRDVFTNMRDSYKLGKNAWVEKIQGEELGRTDENDKRLEDWYSKLNRRVSFDLMAAIDGAAQRYNAHLEAVGMVYRQARERGASVSKAVAAAKEATENGMHHELAVEAMFRSLPSTFQELAIRRPANDGKPEWLDEVVGTGSRLMSTMFDRIPSGFRDADSGEMVPIPVSKVILPFVRTSMAIGRAAARHSVLGNISVITAAMRLKELKKEGAGDEQVGWAKEQLKRRLYESWVVGAVAMHWLAYALSATGTDTDNKEASYTGRAPGEKTISLFGERIPYSRVEPFATPLAMAANGVRAFQVGKNPIVPELMALAKMGSDLAWFRLIQGTGHMIEEVSKDPSKAAGSIGTSLAEGAAKTMVSMTPGVGNAGVRNILKQDDELRKPTERGFWGTAKAEVGLGETRNVRDVWGRQVRRGPIEADTGVTGLAERAVVGGLGRAPLHRPTDVDRWLESRGVAVTGWKPKDREKNLLGGRELDEYLQIAGPMFLDRMRALKEAAPDMKPDMLKKRIRAMRGVIHKVALAKLGNVDEEDGLDEN